MAKRKQQRDPLREWPDQTPVVTPVSFMGLPTQVDQVKAYFEEWSIAQAEANHVETVEEANNFDIEDDESDDFFTTLTPYEMHDLLEAEADEQIREEKAAAAAESNETGVPGATSTQDPAHVQSAPVDKPAAEQADLSSLVQPRSEATTMPEGHAQPRSGDPSTPTQSTARR